VKSFYVYGIVIDGTVRYVGKGCGHRFTSHIAIAKRLNRLRAAGGSAKVSRFYNRLAKSIRLGAEVVPRILVDDIADENEAYRIERETIDAAPAGQLWNMVVGGAGRFAWCDELKQKHSEWAIGRYKDPVERAKARAHLVALSRDPRIKAMASERMLRRRAENPEQFDRWRMAAYTPEVLAKRTQTYIQTQKDRPELVEQRVIATKKHWSDPEQNAAHRANLKAAHARPDVKAKRRAYYDSPEGRAKLKAASDARWARVRAAQAVAS
jgi:hypothetical protein